MVNFAWSFHTVQFLTRNEMVPRSRYDQHLGGPATPREVVKLHKLHWYNYQ
jgi:hypothetical protein